MFEDAPGTDNDTAQQQIDRYLLSELSASDPRRLGAGIGRRRTAVLLSMLGHPQNAVAAVHVAGTAGKGSVTMFTTNILVAHGFRVGSYLSPHAHSLLERFQINGSPAAADVVLAAMDKVRERERRLRGSPLGQMTMFEAAAATAFQLFRDVCADYTVIETGLGGLHDATNTITRSDKLAVLTAIGYDHTAILGSTLAAIASQKAGILPPGGRAIALRGGEEIDKAVAAEARRRHCSVLQVAHTEIEELLPGNVAAELPGWHQRINAGLAFAAAGELARRDGWAFDPTQAARAVSETCMPGRFELRQWGAHPVILDGAHNAMKLAALADALRQAHPRPLVWVMAMRDDKDVATSFSVLQGRVGVLIATTFAGRAADWTDSTSLPAESLAHSARDAHIDVVTRPDMASALACAAELSPPGAPIIVAGSFLAVADAGRVLMAPPP